MSTDFLTNKHVVAGVDFSGLQAAADEACAIIDRLRKENAALRRAALAHGCAAGIRESCACGWIEEQG